MASTKYDYGSVFESCVIIGPSMKIQMKSERIEAEQSTRSPAKDWSEKPGIYHIEVF